MDEDEAGHVLDGASRASEQVRQAAEGAGAKAGGAGAAKGAKGKKNESPRAEKPPEVPSLPEEIVLRWSNGPLAAFTLAHEEEEANGEHDDGHVRGFSEFFGTWEGGVEDTGGKRPGRDWLLSLPDKDEDQSNSLRDIRECLIWGVSAKHAEEGVERVRRWALRALAESEAARQQAKRSKKAVASIDERLLMDFLFPPEQQHPASTGRLLAVGAFGPLAEDGTLRGGFRGSRTLTVPELRGLMRELQDEDSIGAFAGGAPLDAAARRQLLSDVADRCRPMPDMSRAQVRRLLREVPRDDDGRLSFHGLQELVRRIRHQRRQELRTLYPELRRKTASAHKYSVKPAPPLLHRGALTIKKKRMAGGVTEVGGRDTLRPGELVGGAGARRAPPTSPMRTVVFADAVSGAPDAFAPTPGWLGRTAGRSLRSASEMVEWAPRDGDDLADAALSRTVAILDGREKPQGRRKTRKLHAL